MNELERKFNLGKKEVKSNRSIKKFPSGGGTSESMAWSADSPEKPPTPDDSEELDEI